VVDFRRQTMKLTRERPLSLYAAAESSFAAAMREFITFVDAKGNDPVMAYIGGPKAAEAQKVLTMLDALNTVERLGKPYFKAFGGFTVTLGELIIGPFRIFVHRLESMPGEERYLMVHMFRKKSNETPQREIDAAIKNIYAFRYAQEQ
jgi:phage-related protein